MHDSKNCIDVIRPFARAIEQGEGPISGVQVIGGVCSAALENPAAIINVDAREVIIPYHSPIYLPTHRDDGNLRDFDLLVKSTDEEAIECAKHLVEKTVGDELEHSVFGYKSAEILKAQKAKPLLGRAALKTFLADRYQWHNGYMLKSLFPFAVEMDPRSMETWTLIADDDTYIPIPNPAMSVINYTNRSISGVRPKDRAKIDRIANQLFAKAPELRDWAFDGPGSSQVALGGLLRSLTPDKDHPNYFGLSDRILSHDQLAEHEYFMLPDLSYAKKRAVIAVAALKAQGLNCFESNPQIVTTWQRYIEPLIQPIIMNDYTGARKKAEIKKAA